LDCRYALVIIKNNCEGGAKVQIKLELIEKYQAITDEKEKAIFFNDIIAFLCETNLHRADNIIEITAQRDNLQNKVNRAQALIDEAQAENTKAKKIALGEAKRKLQITRDRLVAVASTSTILGSQINEAQDNAVMIDTLNNIIASVGIITDELACLGLWDIDEIRPQTTPIKCVNPSSKNRVSRKKTTPETIIWK